MSRQLYQDIAEQANVPIAKRGEIVNGRGGSKNIVRRYHLLRHKQHALQNLILSKGHMVSPYGERRIAGMIVNTLVNCGENRAHAFADVYSTFKTIASSPKTLRGSLTAWDRFTAKEARNEATHLDPFPRLLYNIEQLQRLGGNHPWGFKLVQVWACIDVLKSSDGLLMIRLRTGIPAGTMVTPLNENRQRKVTKTVQSLPSGIEVSDSGECDEDLDDEFE